MSVLPLFYICLNEESMKEKKWLPGSFVVSAMFSLSYILTTHSVSAAENISEIDKCMQVEMLQAGNSVTVGEMREQCEKKLTEAGEAINEVNVTQRIQLEKLTWDNPFVVTVHKPNYILLAAYNDKTNEPPFANQFPAEDTSLEDTEVKFQISVKFPLAVDLFDGKSNVYFAYTNRSFWQLYNDNSAPFRETNHEPEVFFTLKNDWKFLGFTNTFINFGFVHQSNGRAATLSRSWNRIFASFIFEKNNMALGFKSWYRIPEDEAEDNNPDIEDFMGNFELTGVYKYSQHTFSAMLRNNLESDDNRGAIQIDWVLPLTRYLNSYVQYFNGYGESLIDYNYDQESIGIGVALTGWL